MVKNILKILVLFSILNSPALGAYFPTMDQGLPNTSSNAWPMYICNAGGTNCMSVNVDGSINTNVSGSVSCSVSNFPATQSVTQGTSPWVISGTVAVSNFPASQNVVVTNTPNVTVTNPSTNYALESGGNLDSINAKLTSPLAVTGAFFQAVQPVSQSGSWTVLANQGTSPWVISGTVTANQGTSPWTISGSVTANIGTTGGLALDATLSALSAKFNSLGQKTMANSAPVVISSDQSAIPVTGTFFQAVQPVSQSGTWTVQQGTPPWSVSQSGAWSTGRTWTLSSGTDSVASAQSGSWTVTANAGTNLNTSTLALSATQTNGTQKSQRVDGSGNVSPAGDVAARKIFVQPTDGTNTQNFTSRGEAINTYLDTTSATQNVTTQDLATTSATGANGQIIYSGTPTANSAASFTLSSDAAATVQVTGTWTGTLQVELSMDSGTTWFSRPVHQTGTAFTVATFAANFTGGFNTAGYSNARVRAVSAITGTATINIVSTNNTNTVYIGNTVALSGHTVNTTFTQNYSTPVTTAAFTTVITATTAAIQEEDIFDTSGGDYFLSWALTCGALSSASNTIIVSAGGGGKDLLIPSGVCVGIKAKTANLTAGSVNMTFYQ